MNNKNPKILGVQKVLYTGRAKNNPTINVNRFFNLGDEVGLIKDGNSVILSRTRKENVKRVGKTGESLKLSLYGISEKMDYYTAFGLNADEILLTPSTSEEIVRFARKTRHSEKNEALVTHSSRGFFLYIKQPFLNPFGLTNWAFYKTEDNLMWFECSPDVLPTENAAYSGVVKDNLLYIPSGLQDIIPLGAEQRYSIQFVNGKVIIEVPNARCDVCKTPIRLMTDKTVVYQVSKTTADITTNICHHTPTEKDAYFNEALKLSKEINILLQKSL